MSTAPYEYTLGNWNGIQMNAHERSLVPSLAASAEEIGHDHGYARIQVRTSIATEMMSNSYVEFTAHFGQQMAVWDPGRRR